MELVKGRHQPLGHVEEVAVMIFDHPEMPDNLCLVVAPFVMTVRDRAHCDWIIKCLTEERDLMWPVA